MAENRWTYRIFLLVACCTVVLTASAADPVPNILVNGEIADADDVNANFQALVDQITVLEGDTTTLQGQLVPVGTILSFGSSTPPTGFFLCDGSQKSSATYLALFTAIGTTWGDGSDDSDETTDFNVPDLRGRFLRGVDPSGIRDPDATSRTDEAGATVGAVVGSVQVDELKSHSHDLRFATSNFTGQLYQDFQSIGDTFEVTNSTSILPTGGTETRPKNAYVNYIIKY